MSVKKEKSKEIKIPTEKGTSLEEMKEFIKSLPHAPIQIQMFQSGFDFVILEERIANVQKYKEEHLIVILKEDKELMKYQARIIYNDGKKEIINLFEMD